MSPLDRLRWVALVASRPLSPTCYRLAAHLAIVAMDGSGVAWASRPSLAAAIGCHVARLTPAFRELVEAGFLERGSLAGPVGRQTYRWELTIPPASAAPGALAAPPASAAPPGGAADAPGGGAPDDTNPERRTLPKGGSEGGREGGSGGAHPTTTTTPPAGASSIACSTETDPRLAWLAAAGVGLDAKADTRARWTLAVDLLSLADVQAIHASRRSPIAWPSQFLALRNAYAAHLASSDIDPALAADRRARAAAHASAKAADQQRIQAQRDLDQAAQAATRAAASTAYRSAMETPLGRRWAGLVAAWGAGMPSVMRRTGTYPIALHEGRLRLHVSNPLDEYQARQHQAAILARAVDAFAPAAVTDLDLIVNGHVHPTIAALPTVAVMAH